jgi:hypothetical protein
VDARQALSKSQPKMNMIKIEQELHRLHTIRKAKMAALPQKKKPQNRQTSKLSPYKEKPVSDINLYEESLQSSSRSNIEKKRISDLSAFPEP